MSIKDLIWVNVAQGIILKEKNKNELDLFKLQHEENEAIHLALCDLRDIALEIHLFTKCHALKGTGGKIKGFDVKQLTSQRLLRQKEHEEKMKNMTPEERAEYDVQRFLNGEIIS
jgi:hypothetical protein